MAQVNDTTVYIALGGELLLEGLFRDPLLPDGAVAPCMGAVGIGGGAADEHLVASGQPASAASSSSANAQPVDGHRRGSAAEQRFGIQDVSAEGQHGTYLEKNSAREMEPLALAGIFLFGEKFSNSPELLLHPGFDSHRARFLDPVFQLASRYRSLTGDVIQCNKPAFSV